MFNKENDKNLSGGSVFGQTGNENGRLGVEINTENSDSGKHRRGRHTLGDFSAFGAPMKAENAPAVNFLKVETEEEAPKQEAIQEMVEVISDEAEELKNEACEADLEEPCEVSFENDVAAIDENPFEAFGDAYGLIQEELTKTEEPVSEATKEESEEMTEDSESESETVVGLTEPSEMVKSEEFAESEEQTETEVTEVTEVTEETAETEKAEASEEADEIEKTEETEKIEENEEAREAEEAETETGYGQITGFGCTQTAYDGQTDEEQAEETDAPAEAEVSEIYGIQQKFDITFLDPMPVEEEPKAVLVEDDILDEAMSEVVEATYSAEFEYEAEESESEESVLEAEGEPSEETEELGEVFEDKEGSESELELKETRVEATEEQKTEDVNIKIPKDVWDEEGREEWQARDKFLEHCRSLVVPPLKISKQEKPVKRRAPARSTTSGYQYEDAERLPIVEGVKTIENEAEYRKKEKVLCKKRAREYEGKLGEKVSKTKVKLWTVAIFLVLSLALDCMNFVNFRGNSIINSGTLTAFGCAEALLLVIVGIITLGIMRDGISCAFKGEHIPETLSAMIMFICLAYNSAVLVLEHGENIPVIMGAPAVMGALLALIYRYKMLCREVKTFSVASAYRPYTTEVRMKDFSSAPEYTEFGGYAPRESELYKINKIYRIDGIYEAQPVRDTCFGIMRALSLVTFCCALVVGLAFGLIEKSVLNGLFCATLVMALGSPVSVFVSMYLPRIKAAKANEQDGSAIVSFDETADSFEKNVIMLDDSELYPAQSLSPKIEVSKTSDMEERLHKVASLFNRLGGTLGSMFNEAGFEDYKEVDLREIEAHGIYAIVDGSDVIVGSEKYLSKYGIKVNRYEDILAPDTGVLYIADGGQFFCRIIMTFKADTELCRRISELRNADTLVSLKSSNPCLDEAMVFTTTSLEPELLKLIKYSSGDDVCPAETDREGKIVSLNGSAGLFSAILEYKRQRRRIFRGSRHSIFSCIVGIIASVGLILGGGAVLKFAPVAGVVLHAVFALIAGAAVSGKAIDTRTVIKKK